MYYFIFSKVDIDLAFSQKLFLSQNLYQPFVNIEWSTNNVLKKTIANFSSIDLKYNFLHTKIDVDKISDIESRNKLNCLNFQ